MSESGAGGRARPLIGVCAALEQARWGVWDLPADILPRMYVETVQRSGGAAVLLPVDPGWIESPGPVLDRLDGLLLAGGSDVDPGSYGAERQPATSHTVPERDACELALLRAALRRDTPVLGICRGMQLINVAAGGTLIQHVPEAYGSDQHMRTPGSFADADHPVRLADGSLVARAAGGTVVNTKSHHHQAIDRTGEGLVVTGWSQLDELPEVVEFPDRRFAIGVQWHPEAGDDDWLTIAFVDAARAGAGPA
jgi:putative glutamine amidotransferase